jgi:hypothetical protein
MRRPTLCEYCGTDKLRQHLHVRDATMPDRVNDIKKNGFGNRADIFIRHLSSDE